MHPWEELQCNQPKRKPDPLVALETLEREVTELVADVRRGRFVRDDGSLLGNVVEYGNETIEAILALRGMSDE